MPFCAECQVFAVFLPADKKLRDPAAHRDGDKREGDAERKQQGPFRKDVVADGHDGDARRQEEEGQVLQEEVRDARNLLRLDDFCTK